MTVRELRRFHRTRPFQPFIIRLADGQELPVLHPEFLAFAPKGRFRDGVSAGWFI